MRLGKVYLDFGYVVDLDNENMVDQAEACLVEDVYSAVKYSEVHNYIEYMEDPNFSFFREEDIPEFLKENLEEEEEDYDKES